MADQFDEFIEEVQNDIRQEKWMDLWKKYGNYVVILICSVILFVTLYNFWSNYSRKKNEQVALSFGTAHMQDKKDDSTIGILKTIADSHHVTYKTLAKFLEAQILLKTKKDEAIVIFNELVNDASLTSELRDLAYILLSYADFEKTNISRIQEIIETDSPWKPLALELKAIMLLKQDKNKEALEIFVSLAKDPKTPKGLSERIKIMAQIVG